ncbi:hypothetical protein [Aquimarina macrocephali]|uniref:hypothetical protein n=1 Tax=Aquimarina macrocephali TaxID=666563 RepID=UPI0004B326E3|nr:hypothetical protein [Aquimarina macrocephali]
MRLCASYLKISIAMFILGFSFISCEKDDITEDFNYLELSEQHSPVNDDEEPIENLTLSY